MNILSKILLASTAASLLVVAAAVVYAQHAHHIWPVAIVHPPPFTEGAES